MSACIRESHRIPVRPLPYNIKSVEVSCFNPEASPCPLRSEVSPLGFVKTRRRARRKFARRRCCDVFAFICPALRILSDPTFLEHSSILSRVCQRVRSSRKFVAAVPRTARKAIIGVIEAQSPPGRGSPYNTSYTRCPLRNFRSIIPREGCLHRGNGVILHVARSMIEPCHRSRVRHDGNDQCPGEVDRRGFFFPLVFRLQIARIHG